MTQTGVYNVEDWWQSADGDDWLPAIMRAQDSVPVFCPLVLEFAPTRYNLSGVLDIIRPRLTLRSIKPGGDNVNSLVTTTAGTPELRWETGGACGVVCHYPGTYTGGTYGDVVVASDSGARSAGWQFTGLTFSGPGVGAGGVNAFIGEYDDHGINIHQAGQMSDCTILGFRGNGIHCNASAGSSINNGNANGCTIGPRVTIQNCGGYGTLCAGGDANKIRWTDMSITDCGQDLPTRAGSYTVLVGRRLYFVTVSAVVAGTERLVVAGTNCDFAVTGGMDTEDVVDGLVAAVNAAAPTGALAQKVDETRLLVYGTTNSTFTCTETSAQLSTSTVAQTASAQDTVYCVGGPLGQGLTTGDNCSCYIPAGTFYGWHRGDVEEATPYGYMSVSLGMDSASTEADSIALVSGSTWRLTYTGGRAWASHPHIGKNVTIRGSEDINNDGTFPITAVRSGLYGAASVRLRVRRVEASSLYWLIISRLGGVAPTLVQWTTAGTDDTAAEIRDAAISAINAASISGVTAASYDGTNLTITGTDVVVWYGGGFDNSDGSTFTSIDYTNASGAADASFDGTWEVQNTTAPQGAYTGAWVYGRGAQVLDHPLIFAKYSMISVNGSTDGDGFVAKGGYSTFDDCYTEGPLQSVIMPPAVIRNGSMYPVIGSKSLEVGNTHVMRPEVSSGRLEGFGGSVRGYLGDRVYGNAAGGMEYVHDNWGERWRWHHEQTGQGRGSWEFTLDADSELVALRLANLHDKRIGVASFATGQPGIFTGYADGSLRPPRSVIPDGSNGVTRVSDSDNTGAVGYLEWRQNGNYRCRVEVLGVYFVASCTSATPPSVNIGTHNIASGAVGRCIVRNIQGTSGANGDRQWTSSGTATITLQGSDGLDVTTTGTNVGSSGIVIVCRLFAFGQVSGTSLSLGSGNWMVGDRFININPSSSDGVEWVCTTTGVAGAAVWTLVDSRVTAQPSIQFQDEGSNIGTAGGVSTVNFVGSGVTAAHGAGTVTVTISSGGGGLTFQQALAVSSLRL